MIGVVAMTASGVVGGVFVRAAPVFEPPYDDGGGEREPTRPFGGADLLPIAPRHDPAAGVRRRRRAGPARAGVPGTVSQAKTPACPAGVPATPPGAVDDGPGDGGPGDGSPTGTSATGTSPTGTSPTGTSATSTRLTGTSATGTSPTGTSATGTRLTGTTKPGGPTAPPARQSKSGRPGARPARPLSAHTAAKRYLDLCVEVLNGYRPAGQLRPFTEPHRFADVADQLVRRTGRVRLGGAPTGRQQRLVRVRRVVISEPVDGVAEAVAILFHGEAVWAMALRLERARGEWLCTFAGVV